MTSLIANFLWIGLIVVFISVWLDILETSRARKEAHNIATILQQLEIDRGDKH